MARLSTAFARDILPMDEFERRAAAVYRASTAEGLAEIIDDLPDERPATAAVARADTGARALLPPRITTLLGNVERGGYAVVPSRLHVRAVLGNVELDLRDAEFGAGTTEISVRAVLGNVEIALPDHVAVENHGGALVGSFVARSKRGTVREGTGAIATVRITGRAVLGNVEFGTEP